MLADVASIARIPFWCAVRVCAVNRKKIRLAEEFFEATVLPRNPGRS